MLAEARDASAQALPRDGSGTSWLPDASPMYAFHWQRGDWQVMLHENAFLQFLDESGDRGSDQAGSINWVMGMAQRTAGPGRLMFRGMFSAEPWTVGGCGYPDLLASGERCNGEAIHDRQHPHDLMMELAAQYDAPLAGLGSLAGVRRAGWRAGAGACGLSASHLRVPQSARANRPSLAGFDTRHVRCADWRVVRKPLEVGGIRFQRPRAGRGSRGFRSGGARFSVRKGVVSTECEAGASVFGRPTRRGRNQPRPARPAT